MQTKSFTIKYEGRTSVISTQCGICEAITPQELQRGIEQPKIREYQAIWDTGAMTSAITPKVVEELQLKPISKAMNYTAGGLIEVDIYAINIYLPCGVGIHSIFASCNDLGDTDVLIGMDVIGLSDFAITNKDGQTTFSFQVPSTHLIDFYTEQEQ